MRLLGYGVLFLLAACSASVKSEKASDWTPPEIANLDRTCTESDELEAGISDASKIEPICRCFTGKVVTKFSPIQIHQSDAGTEKALQEFLADCAKSSGENLSFGFLGQAVRFIREVNEYDPNSAASKVLKKVKPLPGREKPKAPVPSSHSGPAPSVPEAKTESARPEAPQTVDETRASVSVIARNNRLVLKKELTLKDAKSCFRGENEHITCCLELKEGTKLPATLGVGESLVFTGQGGDPTPRDRQPVIIGGQSYIFDSESEVLNPKLKYEPESCYATFSAPDFVTGMTCQKWNPVYRRNFNISIAEMRAVFVTHADYELAGQWKDHPKPVVQPVKEEPVAPAGMEMPKAPVAEKSVLEAPKLPLYGLSDYRIYNAGQEYQVYLSDGHYLVVRKATGKPLGYLEASPQGGYSIGGGPQHDFYRGRRMSLEVVGDKMSLDANLDDGSKLSARLEKVSFDEEQAARTQKLVKVLDRQIELAAYFGKSGFERVSKYNFGDLYRKGDQLYHLDAKEGLQPLLPRSDGKVDFGTRGNQIDWISAKVAYYQSLVK